MKGIKSTEERSQRAGCRIKLDLQGKCQRVEFSGLEGGKNFSDLRSNA